MDTDKDPVPDLGSDTHRSYRTRFVGQLRHDPATAAGLVVLGMVIGVAVFGPIAAPYDPLESLRNAQLLPPSSSHPFGTDVNSMDILSRIPSALRLDLIVSIAGSLMAVVIGASLGGIAAYAGGYWDALLSRLIEVMQAFPQFILAMALIAVIGRGFISVLVVVAFVHASWYARVMRGQIHLLKESEFAQAAQSLGLPAWRILARHLLPNAVNPILVQLSLNIANAIILVAGLSFLGLGFSPPTPELGLMVAGGTETILTGEWWVPMFPALTIVLTVLSFNLVGDGLEDLVDPLRRN